MRETRKGSIAGRLQERQSSLSLTDVTEEEGPEGASPLLAFTAGGSFSPLLPQSVVSWSEFPSPFKSSPAVPLAVPL